MDFHDLKLAVTEIKILGTGCARCNMLEKTIRQAVDELNLNATVEKIDDVQKIVEYGIWKLPGLVINGKVVMSGLTPKLNELKSILTRNK